MNETQSENPTAQNEQSSTRSWLTLAQAAAALQVSEKTLRRRIKAGEIEARKASLDGGGLAWRVHLEAGAMDSVPEAQWTNITDVPEVVPEPKRTIFERGSRVLDSSSASATDIQWTSVPEPSGTRNRQRNEQSSDHELIELLREQLTAANEREKRASLQIEAANRQAAEATAALREYLKLQAKALPSPDQLEQLGTEKQNAAQAPKTGATGKASSTRNVPQSSKAREMRPLWKVILGVR